MSKTKTPRRTIKTRKPVKRSADTAVAIKPVECTPRELWEYATELRNDLDTSTGEWLDFSDWLCVCKCLRAAVDLGVVTNAEASLFEEPRLKRGRGITRDGARRMVDRVVGRLEAVSFNSPSSGLSLRDCEIRILELLRSRNGSLVKLCDMIGFETASERTVKDAIHCLEANGFVDRPRGSKSGFQMTPKGIAAINHTKPK